METPSTSGTQNVVRRTPRNKNTLVNLDTPKPSNSTWRREAKPSQPRKVPNRSSFSNSSKKQIRKSTWKKVQDKETLYKPVPPRMPDCKPHKGKTFQCRTLTRRDVELFHAALYKHYNRKHQHAFLLKHMKIRDVKRRRNLGVYSPSPFRTQYSVFVAGNKNVPVCLNAFLAITQTNKNTLFGTAKRYYQKNGDIIDKRGGFREGPRFNAMRERIKSFLDQLQYSETHYCRGKSARKYLPPELNITMFFKLFLSKENEEPLPHQEDIKLSYFRFIFKSEFNIGFGLPQTDVCSDCQQYCERLKSWPENDRDSTEHVNLRTQYLVHKKRANAFFEILKEDRPNELMITYDCQKNLVLPKIPDGAAYYSRQLYFNNFTVVRGNSHTELNPSTVTSFVWTENQYKRNSNLIASCILYYLKLITDWSSYNKVVLVADGCSGQNKNTSILAMCAFWLRKFAPNTVNEIQLVFPVTGHSFIPPDRVCGNIERIIKKTETIITPEEYVEIVSQFSTVVPISSNVIVLDFQESTRKKPCRSAVQLHFKISQCKRIFFTRSNSNDVLIRGEYFYGMDSGVYKSIFVNKFNATHFSLSEIPERNVIDEAKRKDVDKLLQKHFGEKWRDLDSLKFYRSTLDVNRDANGNEENVDDPEEQCLPTAEGDLGDELIV